MHELDRVVLRDKFNALGKLFEVFDATEASHVASEHRNAKSIMLHNQCVEIELKQPIKEKYVKLLIPLSNITYLVPNPNGTAPVSKAKSNL